MNCSDLSYPEDKLEKTKKYYFHHYERNYSGDKIPKSRDVFVNNSFHVDNEILINQHDDYMK